jgi:hypothetical protein
MGVAGRKMAIRLRKDWIFLDCKEQAWKRLLEATAEQVSGTD